VQRSCVSPRHRETMEPVVPPVNTSALADSGLDLASKSAPPQQLEGLDSAEAQRRLHAIGPNALPETASSVWRRALGKFSAPIPWLLEIAILLQFALREYAEAAVIAVLLVFNAALGLIQEGRAQETLDALKSRLALLASVRRMTYQRILTYTLRSVTAKINQMLLLTVGLFMTGHAILTPMLMVIVMISGDFLAMSATTDNVHPSAQPNAWRIGRITVAAIVLGICAVIFSSTVLAIGYFQFGLENRGLRTLAAVTLVCSSQATFYVVRDRRHLWSSRPSAWVLLSSVVDVSIIVLLAGTGTLMHALPWLMIAAIIVAAALFSFFLDAVKTVLFKRLRVA
jgi:magnesium-transporting ATPase (P-type)